MTGAGDVAATGLAGWLSDRLHPILVRDVKQAIRGRVYSVAMTVSCLSILAIGLLAVDRDRAAIELSRWTLVTTLRCVVPIVLFAVPLGAFLSLREEVAERTAEQLVLTRMRPLSIVAGMLLASLVLALLFVAMFVPLLAFSYMLLAVDVPTLLQCVWLLLLGSLLLSSASLALLRIGRFRALREHAALVAVIALGTVCLGLIRGMDDVVLWLEANARSPDFGLIAIQQVTMLSLGIAFFALLGAGCLSHIQENRATGQRLVGVIAAPTLTLFFGAGMPGATVACAGLAVFWFPAVTEAPRLAPRHRALVPADPRAAVRMLPFLPGSARGLLYAMLLASLAFVSGLATHHVFRGAAPTGAELLEAALAVEYVALYAALSCWLRNHRFEQHRLTTSIARLRLPGLTLLVWLALAVVDGLLWALSGVPLFALSTVNPFFVLDAGLGVPTVIPLWVTALLLLPVTTWLWWQNRTELREAAREVRERAWARRDATDDATGDATDTASAP